MKSLLLLFLLLGFTSSSWADLEKPSGNFRDNVDYNEYLTPDVNDGVFKREWVDGDGNDTGSTLCTEKSKNCNNNSIKKIQIRKNGWQQKPTSIKKKPLNFKSK